MDKCEWFALCDNDAVGVVAHPILGNLPTCQRCADKLELDLVPYARSEPYGRKTERQLADELWPDKRR